MNPLKIKDALCGLAALIAMAGCNVGMAPEPMSREEASDALGKMSPQDQIKYYRDGPMPREQKDAKIAEIEAKYGVKEQASGPPNSRP